MSGSRSIGRIFLLKALYKFTTGFKCVILLTKQTWFLKCAGSYHWGSFCRRAWCFPSKRINGCDKLVTHFDIESCSLSFSFTLNRKALNFSIQWVCDYLGLSVYKVHKIRKSCSPSTLFLNFKGFTSPFLF